MKNTVLACITLLFVSATLFGQTQGWKKLTTANYSIDYPANWELSESGSTGTNFMIFSPMESPEDQFRENVNLMIQDLSAYDLDLDSYTELSEQQVGTLFTDAKIIKSKRMKNQSHDYHMIIYNGGQGGAMYTFLQYYWVINDKAYVLTLTCEKDQYKAYKKMGLKIMNSFTLK